MGVMITALRAVASSLAVFLSLRLCALAQGERVDVAACLQAVTAVGPHGAGHRAAIAASQQLTRAHAEQLPEILAGMDRASPLALNWLRGAVEAIAQQELDRGGRLPQAALEAFLADAAHGPHARRTAYELVLQADATAEQRLIPGLLNDPSLELRRDAVARALATARQHLDGGRRPEATAAYRTAFTAARDLDQIQEAAKQLRALGESVDLPRHFGFVTSWKIIGPFDNTGQNGFDVVYGPEGSLDLTAIYPGKTGPVTWFDHTTTDDYGNVDLTQALAKHKGAIAYACAEYVSDRERVVDFRLGCINANKLWLNGTLLTANHVYHSGTSIDQYISRGRLRAGRNAILLKICQNEQTESWAQSWQFQLRICDATGTAVPSTKEGGGPARHP
jgi:hypothetical protein